LASAAGRGEASMAAELDLAGEAVKGAGCGVAACKPEVFVATVVDDLVAVAVPGAATATELATNSKLATATVLASLIERRSQFTRM